MNKMNERMTGIVCSSLSVMPCIRAPVAHTDRNGKNMRH